MKVIKLSILIFLCLISFSYSQETGTVIDIEGNNYKTVKIGDQWWMAENLKVTKYRNGDAIPNVTNDTEWANLSTGGYCNYEHNEANVAIYGRLYNWYAINDPRNLAPEGWHVPTDEDWKKLEMYLGMSRSEADKSFIRGTNEGGKLKETGTAHWSEPNEGATNESGFSALPGGARSSDGQIGNMGNYALFWASTTLNNFYAWGRRLNYNNSGVYRIDFSKPSGFSMRFVKDQSGSGIESKSEIPKIFELYQNYPNPFNPSTIIEFDLEHSSFIELKIYDLNGREVKTLVSSYLRKGRHSIEWNATDVPNGVYIYTLNNASFVQTRKLIVLK